MMSAPASGHRRIHGAVAGKRPVSGRRATARGGRDEPGLTREDKAVDPRVTARVEQNRPIPTLMWRFAEPRLCISSGPLGGGIGPRNWLINATVPLDYHRMDPDRHLTEIAGSLGLVGTGCGLLTAVDVTEHHLATDGGVHAAATVGLSSPTWAAMPDGHFRRLSGAPATVVADHQTVGHRVGTINIVVAVPVPLSQAALVNAAATATEAKVQALHEAGVPATGTASDAIVVHCRTDGAAESYGGPRSTYGARIARATHSAVLAGTRFWLSKPHGSPSVGAGGIEPPTAGV
jgi:adenosylcobinamide amidohydrolase